MLGYFKLLITFLCFVALGRAEIYAIQYDSQFFFQQFEDEQATFGPQLAGEKVVRGQLAGANPSDACTTIDTAPADTDLGKWIVLIARYTERQNCSFEQKIRMAQNANYSAAIVFNVYSEQLVPMSAKNSTGINIPSVFVSYSTGKSLRKFIDPNYYIVITGDSSTLPHLLVPFAIVVGICLIVMIIFMIVKFIKDRRRQRRHRLPTSTLSKIPTCKYQKGDPYETCAICLEDYVEGEKLRVLPCNHAYHAKCIDPWLTKNRRVCPICKRKVFAHDEPRHDSDSDSDGSPADDRTPLINNRSNSANQTQGGTFASLPENSLSAFRAALASRLLRPSQSDHHSINGEYHPDNSSTSSSSASSTSSDSSHLYQSVEISDELATATATPGRAGDGLSSSLDTNLRI